MRQIDYYNHARDNRPKVLTPQLFHDLLRRQSVAQQLERVRTTQDEESKADLKAALPAICWHGHCTAEARRKEAMIPSGLAMLDLDGAPSNSPNGGEPSAACRPQWIDELVARFNEPGSPSLWERFGVGLIHVTPSGQGLRIVGDMSVVGCHNIVAWQRKMVDMLDLRKGEDAGLFHIDTCVKDLSRISFVVSEKDILYLNEELLWADPQEGWTYEYDNNASFSSPLGRLGGAETLNDRAATTATSCSNVSQANNAPVPKDEELEQARSFLYNDHSLSEIAEKWLSLFGHPVKGERHGVYMQLVKLFKNICEQNALVLYAQLPTFDKPDKERWESIQYVLAKNTSATLDSHFKSFLIDCGFRAPDRTMSDIRAEQSARVLTQKVEQEEAARKAREDERLAALMADIEAEETADGDWGKYPSVYNIYKRVLPAYMHKPAVLALDAIMGTLCSNVTARYLNGKMERPCFHNLIIGPASCGKGFIADMHTELTRKLLAIDTESLLRWRAYDDERRRKRGAKELPAEPDVHFRLMETVFSNSSLLKRQSQGNGLHQLVFCTELDSLYKNGGHKKFDDIYRCAYHMEDMSQFYLWSDGFNGRVTLMLNVLATGTPKQFAEHYPNPENGLISRVNWYRITEMFSDEFVQKELTANERGYLDRVTDFALALSYGEDEEGKRTFLPPRDITSEMAFMLPVCQDFLNKHLGVARESVDLSRDQFRKRIALDMYRGAMVDWCCALGKLDKKRRQTIIDFRWAKAEEMLDTKVAEFGEMVNKENVLTEKKCKFPSLYAAMPEKFTISELEQTAQRLVVTTPVRVIVCAWNKAGIINKKTKTSYEKIES